MDRYKRGLDSLLWYAALIKNLFPSIFCGFSKTDPQYSIMTTNKIKLELAVGRGTGAGRIVSEAGTQLTEYTASMYCLREGGHAT